MTPVNGYNEMNVHRGALAPARSPAIDAAALHRRWSGQRTPRQIQLSEPDGDAAW
jgi:hypothetical protein